MPLIGLLLILLLFAIPSPPRGGKRAFKPAPKPPPPKLLPPDPPDLFRPIPTAEDVLFKAVGNNEYAPGAVCTICGKSFDPGVHDH